MELFYASVTGNIVTLSAEESRHCVKVLRHKKNDIIHIIDGLGTMYDAKVIQPDPRATIVEITDRHHDFGKVPYNLSVALSPLKNNARYEWFVEKATEIGITEIIPMITHYTEKSKIKIERLEKILISAAKQSMRAKLPVLHEVQSFEQLLRSDFEQKLIAVCDAHSPLIEVYQKDRTTLILIGPEGGFTQQEMQLAHQQGFIPVRIGNSRLRAETAAIVATSVIANVNLN